MIQSIPCKFKPQMARNDFSSKIRTVARIGLFSCKEMISCISKLFQLVSKICWYLATFVLPSLVLTYFPAAGRLLQSFLHAFSLDKKSASHVDYAIPAKKKLQKNSDDLILLQKLFKSKTVRNF